MPQVEFNHRGYTGICEYSQEDGCYVVRCQNCGCDIVSTDGKTLHEAEENFEDMVDFYLESLSVNDNE